MEGRWLDFAIVAIPHQREKGVRQVVAAGEDGQAAGFVDGQQMGVFVECLEREGGLRFGPGLAEVGEGIATPECRVVLGGRAVQLYKAVLDAAPPFGFGRMGIATQVESEQRLSFAVRVDSVGIGVSLVGHVAGRMTDWRPSVAIWLTVGTLTGDSFTLPLRSLSWQRNCDGNRTIWRVKVRTLARTGQRSTGSTGVCCGF